MSVVSFILLLLHWSTIVCSFQTAVVYMVTKELRDLQSYCVLHLALNLAISRIFWHVLFQGYQLISENDILCVTNTYLWFYFLISTFTWMCCLSYSFWQTAKGNAGNISTLRQKLTYALIGYGFPIIFGAITLALASVYYPMSVIHSISCQRGLLFFKLLPLLLIIWVFWVPNLFFFIASMRRLRKDGAFQVNRGNRLKVAKFRFCLYLKLFLIMGLPYTAILIMWVLHIVFNTHLALLGNIIALLLMCTILGEGVWIFLLMVVFRQKARKAFANITINGHHVFPAFMRSSRQLETEEEEEEEDVTPPVRYNERQFVDIENNLPI